MTGEALALVLLAAGVLAPAAGVRRVHGTVTDEQGKPVQGAVVYLENRVSLQVRTYVTDRTGTYEFTGLSTNIDYDLRARAKNGDRAEQQLTRFDTRKDAVVNLQVQPPG